LTTENQDMSESSETTGSELAVSSNGRDDRGRFSPGNTFGKGNPTARRMAELRSAFLDCVDAETMREVVESLGELVRSGDTAAIRIVLEYTMGKPPQALEITGKDGEPLGAGLVLSTIMVALKDHPEARVAVATAFRKLGSGDGLDQPEPGA
jgi:hypothetical protein